MTPKSLYLVTALLIQYGVMKLEDVYGLLAPEDAEIARMSEKEIRDAKEFVRKLNIVSTAAKNDEEDKEDKSNDVFENNQKFGLLEALIKIGDWTDAQKILCQLPTYFATSQPDVSKELCKLINILIDPLYQSNSGLCLRIRSKVHTRPDNEHFPAQVRVAIKILRRFFGMASERIY